MSLEIHVFGPKYGESIVLALPDGSWGLVDCFSSGGKTAALDFLNARGVTTLDFFCWTHPDEDHSTGIPALLSRFPGQIKEYWRFPAVDMRQIVASIDASHRKMYFHSKSQSYIVPIYEQLKSLRQDGARLTHVYPNLVLKETADYKITGLAPTSEVVEIFAEQLGKCFEPSGADLQKKGVQHYNDISTALLIEYAGVQIVLGGDVTGAGWQAARARWNKVVGPCLVVKASHHGSEHSYVESIWQEWQAMDPTNPTTIVVTPYRKGYRLPTLASSGQLSRHGSVFLTGSEGDPALPSGPGWALIGTLLDPEIDHVVGSRSDHFYCQINSSGALEARGWA